VLIQENIVENGSYAVKVGLAENPHTACEELDEGTPLDFSLWGSWADGTKLHKMIQTAIEEWYRKGEFHSVPNADLARFKELVLKAVCSDNDSKEEESKYKAAIEEFGEPAGTTHKPLAGKNITDIYSDLRDARKRKREAEFDESLAQTRIKTIMVKEATSSIEIQDPKGTIGKISWKPSVRKSLNKKKVEELLSEDAFESCFTETSVRTFLVT
jgi:hypothetical protein